MARRSGTCRALPRAARSAIEELLESAKVEGERLAAVAPEACYADAHGKLTAYWQSSIEFYEGILPQVAAMTSLE